MSQWGSRKAREVLAEKPVPTAWDVSADGSTVVGSAGMGGDEREAELEPVRWTLGDGMESLGFLPGTSRGEALAISRDGQVIVGYSGNNDVQAFRLGTNGIMQGLGFLPGYVTSIARDVSSDGSVIVGECWSGGRPEELPDQAFRWTETGQMIGLGFLPGCFGSEAHAVSADGSIVVGTCDYHRAFIWDAVHGMRDLQSVLTNQFGLSLPGWDLKVAEAISADGTIIVGSGTNPQGKDEAWMANLGAVLPDMSIRRFADSIVVSWPVAFTNFVLEAKASFALVGVWSPVTSAPSITANEFVVTNSIGGGAAFYRLKSQ